METINDLILSLKDILKNEENREILVNNYINVVLNIDLTEDECNDYEEFISLANLLEFYEPNDEKRSESDDLFDDEKLEFYVKECIQKLS